MLLLETAIELQSASPKNENIFCLTSLPFTTTWEISLILFNIQFIFKFLQLFSKMFFVSSPDVVSIWSRFTTFNWLLVSFNLE